MRTTKITILMQMTKIHEILIMLNEKPNIIQISKTLNAIPTCNDALPSPGLNPLEGSTV
jgi:hypothetical protein